jgi:glutaredoxin
MMKRAFLLICLMIWTNAYADELYRSIDKDGKVHYGDSPLQDSEDVTQLKLGNEPTPDENLPYETLRAKQNFPVTLYTFSDCGSACQQARDLLNKRGIPFTEKSLVTQEEMDAFRKDSGNSMLPSATIGKTWVKGFLADQWNQELDFSGYPKNVLTYRAPHPASSVQPAP